MRVMMMHLDQVEVGCDVHGMCDDDERDYEGGGLENVSKKTRFQFINPGVCVTAALTAGVRGPSKGCQ